MEGIEPAGSVVTGLGTPAASAECPGVQATPLVPSSTLLPANVQASPIPPQMLLPTGQSLRSPAPTSSQFLLCMLVATLTLSWLSSLTPPSKHPSLHLQDSWGALWWTSSATSPGPGCTSTTGPATGRLASGSILSENIRQIVYQFNLLILCSGVVSGVRCRCALCRVEGDLALVCLFPAAFPLLGLASARLPAGAASHTAPPNSLCTKPKFSSSPQ